MILLFGVEGVFEIPGRGVVLVPGPRAAQAADLVLRAGDRIVIRHADGDGIETTIRALEFADNLLARTSRVVILLPPEIRRSDLDGACQVWWRCA